MLFILCFSSLSEFIVSAFSSKEPFSDNFVNNLYFSVTTHLYSALIVSTICHPEAI